MKRIIPAILIALAVFASAVLLVRGAKQESPAVDEIPHIGAGYSYLHELDYRLNPEHPPLTKALAGLFIDGTDAGPEGGEIVFPSNDPSWQQDVNGQWDFGQRFLYRVGNDGKRIVYHARFGAIALTLLLILLFAGFTWKRFGMWWGTAGAVLLGFSPFMLGHGNLVTTDVAAALGALIGTISFGWYLQKPTSWSRASVAGIAFGVAQLCKYSLILLIPAYIILALLYVFYENREKKFTRWTKVWHGVRSVLIVAIIGYAIVVYPTYKLLTQNYPPSRQARDTAFILGSFAGGPTEDGHLCNPGRCIAEAVIGAAKIPALQPIAEYALGVLMVVQRADGGSTTYFIGSVSSKGAWLYFPIVYLLKETIPLLVLLVVAALYGIGRFLTRSKRTALRFREWVLKNPTEALIAIFVFIYWSVSIRSSLNIGVRHLMPVIPLMYFLGLRGWKEIVTRHHKLRNYVGVALVLLMAGQIATAYAAAPYFLPYYNPLAGGTMNGYRYAVDSNYDWGQDLPAFKAWLDEHPEVDRVAFDYFGWADVYSYLGDRTTYWASSYGNPTNKNIHWFAVSITYLQDGIQPLVSGQPRDPETEYRWLQELRPRPAGMGTIPEPDYHVGTGILVYKLE